MTVLVEACVEDARSARLAADAGADRLELCSNLAEGGMTPAPGTLTEARQGVRLPFHVLIRARGGAFQYTGDEVEGLLRDIARAHRDGAAGVALGALDAARRVDRATVRRLLAAARPMAVTFHRAFDQVPDPFEALDSLIELGIDRVLTAGQALTAVSGIPLLKELVTRAADRICILAGGGIRADNVRRILAATGVREIHLRAGPRAEWLRGVVRELRCA